MKFWRAHGLGNDYLVLESGDRLSPALVAAICDRHRGVGSDGVLEPVPPLGGADYGLRIHNPDGSEAEKSGNGLRIFARWLARKGAASKFSVWTPGGVVWAEVQEHEVRVDMGPARCWGPEVLAGHRCFRVDVGNPHAVVPDPVTDWRAAGAAIEHSVPGRTNVQFITLEDGELRVKVWERGAGETASSGSSACAVAVIAAREGWAASPVVVHMPGGALTVHVGERLLLVGPVEGVGAVEVEPAWLLARTREGVA